MRTQAEANLDALIESTEDSIWSVDLDYRLILFNRAMQQSIEDTCHVRLAPGMRIHEVLPPERAALWPPFYARVLAEGPFRVEYDRMDGHTQELSFNPIVAEGKTTGISVFSKDISKHKQAEERLVTATEALRVREEHYHTIFQTSMDCISITHREDGRILDVNQQYLRMFGYEREEVVGRTTLELGIWTDPRDRQTLVEALRIGPVSQDLEFLLAKKNGEQFWVRVSGSEIQLGGIPSFLIVIRDVSESKAAAEAMRVNEERYRTAFQTSIDAITISHLEDGEFVDVNEAFLRIFGYRREEVVGHTSVELNIWSSLQDRERMVDALRRDSTCKDLEFQLNKKNGKPIWVLVSGARIDLDGIASFLLVVRDISETKAAAEALRLSEMRYRTAFQTSIDSISITRMDNGKYIDCNQAFLDTLGYTREEVIGRTSLELEVWADSRDRRTMIKMVNQSSSCRSLEVQIRKKNGELMWGEMSASRMEVDGAPCLLSVTRDLSESKAAENEIRSLAFYDPLTGLPNRRLLLERLHQSQAGETRDTHARALLLVDLDNFKTLNDTLGHQTGDLLLQQVAERIVSCVPEAGTVGRLGSDEFVVLLDDLSEVAEEAATQAETVGEKIQVAVNQPFLLMERECLSTASIGITFFGGQQNTTDEILQQADIALHQAKAAGCNVMRFFSVDLQNAVNARALLEDDLRRAIKTDQFLLFYQPQVERGRMTGAEALIRWQHPVRGMVPPNEFIPLAEESRLILPIGDWVLQTACAQIALWARQRQTSHLTVSVNISAVQFREPEFVETVLKALDRAGANPGNLKLELTESMLVHNLEDVIAKMTALKSHGLSFSLDDFGTGYSSLAYLKRLPLDQLKIDRAFVRDMLVDLTSGAIAQAVISLGRAMGLSVMAEGVETEEQRGFLAGLGCHAFQGFLFSPPLPLEDFEAFL